MYESSSGSMRSELPLKIRVRGLWLKVEYVFFTGDVIVGEESVVVSE